MRANELRIGNWVNVPHGNVQIDEIYTDSVRFTDHNGGTFASLDPIPITPELLQKAGFQCTKVTTHDEWGSRTEYNYSSGDVFRTVTIRHWPNAPVPYLAIGRVIIESLHQLQNLYFALTGEELNIEL